MFRIWYWLVTVLCHPRKDSQHSLQSLSTDSNFLIKSRFWGLLSTTMQLLWQHPGGNIGVEGASLLGGLTASRVLPEYDGFMEIKQAEMWQSLCLIKRLQPIQPLCLQPLSILDLCHFIWVGFVPLRNGWVMLCKSSLFEQPPINFSSGCNFTWIQSFWRSMKLQSWIVYCIPVCLEFPVLDGHF